MGLAGGTPARATETVALPISTASFRLGKATLKGNNPTRRAVIDIGTNSVDFLVADVAGQALTPIAETSKQTRLGAGFYGSRQLQKPAMSLTVQAVTEFARSAAELGAREVHLIATSAARNALNVAPDA